MRFAFVHLLRTVKKEKFSIFLTFPRDNAYPLRDSERVTLALCERDLRYSNWTRDSVRSLVGHY